MDIATWLKLATDKLKAVGISSARLDALILLEDATGKDRSWLLAHPELKLNDHSLSTLNLQLKRRSKHEPIAYIRGRSEFYGRIFQVTPATLQPRSETETMITLLKETVSLDSSWTIIDIGTGSGCIAITAKLELPKTTVYATDIDASCLSVASKNAAQLAAEVSFYEGNILEPIMPKLTNPQQTILLANLPYVPSRHQINEAAQHEPSRAIFGGADGLNLYRELFTSLPLKSKPLFILAESLPPQHDDLAAIAHSVGYKLSKTADFIQLFTFK